jgi:hypothetical protein
MPPATERESWFPGIRSSCLAVGPAAADHGREPMAQYRAFVRRCRQKIDVLPLLKRNYPCYATGS